VSETELVDFAWIFNFCSISKDALYGRINSHGSVWADFPRQVNGKRQGATAVYNKAHVIRFIAENPYSKQMTRACKGTFSVNDFSPMQAMSFNFLRNMQRVQKVSVSKPEKVSVRVVTPYSYCGEYYE